MAALQTPFVHPTDVSFRLALARALLAAKLATQEQLNAAMAGAKADNRWFITHLLEQGIDADGLAATWATVTGLPVAPRAGVRQPDPHVVSAVPLHQQEQLLAVPYQKDGDALYIAFAVPLNPELTGPLPAHIATAALETDVREGLKAAKVAAQALADAAKSGTYDESDPLGFRERLTSGPGPAVKAAVPKELPEANRARKPLGPESQRRPTQKSLLERLMLPAIGAVIVLVAGAIGYRLVFAEADVVVPPPPEPVAVPVPEVVEAPKRVPYTLDAPAAVRAASKTLDTALGKGDIAAACSAFSQWRAAMLPWVEKIPPSPRMQRVVKVMSDFDRDLGACATTPLDELKGIWERYQVDLAPDA